MTNYPDITASRDSNGFAFSPHSAKADDFLFYEFGQIGTRDLTMQDADLIIRRATRRGFVVRDLLKTEG